MTRDEIALRLLVAMLSNPSIEHANPSQLAKFCYAMADALQEAK